ncbi:MAG: lipoprotein-releasing system ATP-binding protein LolD, partial [Calditrichaeota bacterium]|nr:lipoprotein-releasing system ATP-binding protein LolD [Calditrichota bacterium]
VARALMNKPRIVFCDEPTGNLDHKNSELMFQLFKDLSQKTGTTFIVVSHSSILADFTDDRILLEDGVIKKSE